jgi:uncharacterized protein YceH (UPF0502 family)
METSSPASAPRWRPLERVERRVVGVLAEKAKTTPDVYPLSLNAIVTGSNQKSNRFPQMTLDEDQAQQALDGLRRAGAVTLVQGDSRVERFRHLLYDWLGVDKAELAVMTELLLRGAQTVGELRGRAARMEPFHDLGALMPVVDSLVKKNLVLYLSPPGRGAVVTHNLYQPQELAKVKSEHSSSGHSSAAEGSYEAAAPARGESSSATPAPSRYVDGEAPAAARAVGSTSAASGDAVAALREELAGLRRELADVRERCEDDVAAMKRDLEDLKRQLGG